MLEGPDKTIFDPQPLVRWFVLFLCVQECGRLNPKDMLLQQLLELLIHELSAVAHQMYQFLTLRLTSALEKMQWPSDVKSRKRSIAVDEFRKCFEDLLIFQFCTFEVGVTIHDSTAAPATLWAVRSLVQPILLRFRYHFEGRRETNQRSKPE